jgi:cytochrome b561
VVGFLMETVTGYSRTQIALHWMVVVLVVLQFVANSGMVTAWNAFLDGEPPPAETEVMVTLHIFGGGLILLMVLSRIYLRFTRGAPPPPADEPWILQVAAEAVHLAIYVFLLLLPATGVMAWFAGVPLAGTLHAWLTKLLLTAIALHVGGALFQHFVRRSNVLIRMFRSQSR